MLGPRPHVDVPVTRAALGAQGLAGERGDLGIVGIFRHVDQALVSARIVEAVATSRCTPRRRRILPSIIGSPGGRLLLLLIFNLLLLFSTRRWWGHDASCRRGDAITS